MFSKYILVGIINTVITALLIFLLMYLRFGVYTSNAIGYIVGIYIINLTIIYLVLFINNEWIYFAQLCGMGAYTVSGFIFNKLWVMK